MRHIDISERPRIDLAAEIRERVGMAEIAKHYAGETPVQNRIPCPFHNGRDRNLALYPEGYKCYVCGAHGDAVSFVRQLTGLDFIGAVKDIDRVFGLGLPIEGSGAISPALLREAASRALRRRMEDLSRQEEEEDLDLLWDAFALCDRALREAPPDSEQYALAAKNIDWVKHLILSYG